MSALLCCIIYWEPLSKAANNLMSKGLRYCWANVQGPLIGRGGCKSFIHRIDQDMKDITGLGKTITFQYSKSNMITIVKLALILKVRILCFFNYSFTPNIVISTTRYEPRNFRVLFVCSENFSRVTN